LQVEGFEAVVVNEMLRVVGAVHVVEAIGTHPVVVTIIIVRAFSDIFIYGFHVIKNRRMAVWVPSFVIALLLCAEPIQYFIVVPNERSQGGPSG